MDKSEGGVVLPETSPTGSKWTVISVGPDVKGLEMGDEVMVIGEVGMDIARVPREKGVFVTKQSNVILVVGE